MKLETIEVEVTAEDIQEGSPGDPKSCPVARAVKRGLSAEFIEDMSVSVSATKICLCTNTTTSMYNLDLETSSFIRLFDDGKPVVPFKVKANFSHCFLGVDFRWWAQEEESE